MVGGDEMGDGARETEAEARQRAIRASARRRLDALDQAKSGLLARGKGSGNDTALHRIAQARKREAQRIDHLVLGLDRPMLIPVRPAGMSRQDWKIERRRQLAIGAQLEPDIERAMQVRERWSGKQANPETLEHAANTHDGALAQLHANGTIDSEQLEWTAQISNVHRSIEADVAVKVASFEARVDQSSRSGAVGERIHRVRMHHAYGIWREMIPAPKALVLDMIVGDAIGYTVAATRHRVHKRKSKRLLLEAIQRWPMCVAAAFSVVDQSAVDAMNDAVDPGRVIRHPASHIDTTTYERARRMEPHREATNEPYLLPAIGPEFLDDRGHLLPWAQIAAIVRGKVAALHDGEYVEAQAA